MAAFPESRRKRVLEPVERVSEVLFGLIMVLTFTGSLSIAEAGHEVGSHGWDHRRAVGMAREEFREDARTSKDALEQVTGRPVVGYRAPTFSITQESAWALEVLVEEGYVYDSSIYPVRHDRYGMQMLPSPPSPCKQKPAGLWNFRP